MSEIKKVLVVGGGAMGRQIALTTAINGVHTTLVDTFDGVVEAVEDWSNQYLDGRIAKGKLTKQEVADTKARFVLKKDLESSLQDIDLVIEAVFERLDVKLDLFKKLDELAPEKTILASNSSTWLPSTFASVTGRADKVINLHYFNPALQKELVEVVLSDKTSTETADAVMKFAQDTKKVAIKINKEIEGFVVNNILNGITKAAWKLLENGIASAQDIDLGAEKGLGHPMGPFKLLDFVGLDTILDIRTARYNSSKDPDEKPSKILVDLVKNGHTGVKAGKGFYDYTKKEGK